MTIFIRVQGENEAKNEILIRILKNVLACLNLLPLICTYFSTFFCCICTYWCFLNFHFASVLCMYTDA